MNFRSHLGQCVAAIAILVAFCLLSPAQSAQPEQKPDIVLIVADDLGWGDLGCYGSEDIQSPNLDTLAAEGQIWTHFYANCCVCSPTRASIMTGSYPDRVGVPGVIRTHANNSWGKLAQVPTLPEVLAEAGYQTSCIGKWHLGLEDGDHPQDRGFEHFHGFLGDMMDDYFTHLRHGNNYMRQGRMQIDPSGHATTLFADWANQSIDSMTQSDQPYFLYLAFNAPHTPIQPPPEALQRVQNRLPNTPLKRAKLIALIEDMDAAIGRVLKNIADKQRDTLIVFVSDNGGQLDAGANNGPLRDGKQSNYEGGLRIPAIFHWKNRIESGSRCASIGVTMDLLPTLCKIAGAATPSMIDGLDLNPWLNNPVQPQPAREVYFVRREGGFLYCGLTIEALRSEQWKLVHNFPTQGFELFDLEADPGETNDLSMSNPSQLRIMLNKLMPHIQNGGRVNWQPLR